MSTRINLNDLPHKAIRNFMSQFCLQSGICNFAQEEELQTIKKMGRDSFLLLSVHNEIENKFMLPEMEKKDPNVTKFMHKEHQRIEIWFSDLIKSLQNLKSHEKNIEQKGREFYLNINLFYSDYLQHMNFEETTILEIIWKFFTDEELLKMRKAIMDWASPEFKELVYVYGIPAFRPFEQSEILKQLKLSASPSFYARIQERLSQH